MPAERYSTKAFPAYRYVPGKTPHPTRDPDGHSRNHLEQPLSEFQPQDWPNCQQFLYGIDLFNYGYWWEAHEALEGVWVAAGRDTDVGQFIQGLIQIAVAHLKDHQGFRDVAVRMAQSGLDKMKSHHDNFLGIDMQAWSKSVRRWCDEPNHAALTIILHK